MFSGKNVGSVMITLKGTGEQDPLNNRQTDSAGRLFSINGSLFSASPSLPFLSLSFSFFPFSFYVIFFFFFFFCSNTTDYLHQETYIRASFVPSGLLVTLPSLFLIFQFQFHYSRPFSSSSILGTWLPRQAIVLRYIKIIMSGV